MEEKKQTEELAHDIEMSYLLLGMAGWYLKGGFDKVANSLYEFGWRKPKSGYWVNQPTGFCSCSECHTLGSRMWKCCPVCMAVMESGE